MQFQSTAIVPVGSPVNSVRYDADMASVNARLDALEKGTPTPPGPIVVLSAIYRQVSNPSIGKPCASMVQAATAKGLPYYVYSDTKNADGTWACLNDPSWSVSPNFDVRDWAYKIAKECFVTGTVNGAPKTWLFAQYDRIVLT